jgi:hypothetical protein
MQFLLYRPADRGLKVAPSNMIPQGFIYEDLIVAPAHLVNQLAKMAENGIVGFSSFLSLLITRESALSDRALGVPATTSGRW